MVDDTYDPVLSAIAVYGIAVDKYDNAIKKLEEKQSEKVEKNIEDILKDDIVHFRRIVADNKFLVCGKIKMLYETQGIDAVNSGEIASKLAEITQRIISIDENLPNLIGEEKIEDLNAYEQKGNREYEEILACHTSIIYD